MKVFKMIICIGEILWDYIDNEKLLGGATFNVSYYLNKLGSKTTFISRVGDDSNGKEILDRVSEFNLSSNIQIDKIHPTGTVKVFKNSNNEIDYEISENVAWDFIENIDIEQPYHIVFGTLAQRSKVSRDTINTLINKADKKFYDVNLRKSCIIETVIQSLNTSNIVKVNEDELAYLCGSNNKDIEYNGFKFAEKYNLEALIVTLGSKGSFVVTPNDIYIHEGFKTKVVDTVGCGDSFFASIISGYLNNLDWEQNLEKANKLASQVASIKGAILFD